MPDKVGSKRNANQISDDETKFESNWDRDRKHQEDSNSSDSSIEEVNSNHNQYKTKRPKLNEDVSNEREISIPKRAPPGILGKIAL